MQFNVSLSVQYDISFHLSLVTITKRWQGSITNGNVVAVTIIDITTVSLHVFVKESFLSVTFPAHITYMRFRCGPVCIVVSLPIKLEFFGLFLATYFTQVCYANIRIVEVIRGRYYIDASLLLFCWLQHVLRRISR